MKITQRVAIIGSGKMGEIILSGLLKSGSADKNQLIAADPSSKRLEYIGLQYGVKTTTDNALAVQSADVVLFCIKPQSAPTVFKELASNFNGDKLVLSIMAGVTLRSMEGWLPANTPIVRIMPNTPSQVGEGMSAIAGGQSATSGHIELAQHMFSGVGRTIVLDEKHFDAVTGLSASGPAFIYIVIEALADGGVKSGLPRDVAIELAAQMTLGASKMVLETGKHPAILKDDVTTPAGCTTDGILALEEGGVRVTLIKAVTEAARRACELG
ncbi:MAG: pyrroline-5-carboxylate reductase ProC [Bacteroidetes bacterium HLUCCA01]|nr:MAG: pyrroline-5-carboxylate reductase ProC [Bacteroidetes bacterium HLUCCA01]